MQEEKIYDADGKGFIRTFVSEDVECVNPIEHYATHEINKLMILERDMLNMKNPYLTSTISSDFFYKRALEKWNIRLEEIQKTPIPQNFIKLLSASNKNEQVKLLKGQSLTVFQLGAFIFKAYQEHGYCFSQYKAEHLHNGADEDDLPKLIHIEDDGTITSIGETNLTDGQLKQIIEQRKVTVSKFIDNGPNWHCLFLTFKSLRHEESWKNGQPHLHYISDKWGIKREDLVQRLKSKDIISSKVHIDLLDYN